MSGNEQLVEVWKNTAAGMRWCSIIDRQGRDSQILVRGGRAFSITPFDRQRNQDSAAEAEQDMFRNGTFVLVKAAAETNMSEIESPDSLTDNELISLSVEIQAEPGSVDRIPGAIRSPIALGRVLEQLVIDDVDLSAIEYVKNKRSKFDTSVHAEAERKAVTKAPPKEKKVKTPRTVPDASTPRSVDARAEKVSG